MNRKILVILSISIIVVGVITAAALYTEPFGDSIRVTLPDTSHLGKPSVTGGLSGVDESLIKAELSPETVQAVIKTLRRPEAYSRRINIHSRWSENEGAVYNVETHVNNERAKITVTRDTEVQTILLEAGEVRKYYDSNKQRVYTRDSNDITGDIDAYQMIMSYEDILELDKRDIVSADYVALHGSQTDYCIRVEAKDKLLGYRLVYYVSIETGLLEFAEKYDGELLIYEMVILETDLTAPDESVFE